MAAEQAFTLQYYTKPEEAMLLPDLLRTDYFSKVSSCTGLKKDLASTPRQLHVQGRIVISW